ncbi:hypothetical protein EG68_00582 [Paragonimus skrjabini miyazakii]|uniref:Uncharacterized protein n=1 Tax=Paragonimus skrjabini miyazakii TaxID=59628 RepID=A0A8S9Z5Z9_9TREM|nr:hypothetical protein EG68_00582 [Paragonimus skrjabini miyazakii]
MILTEIPNLSVLLAVDFNYQNFPLSVLNGDDNHPVLVANKNEARPFVKSLIIWFDFLDHFGTPLLHTGYHN